MSFRCRADRRRSGCRSGWSPPGAAAARRAAECAPARPSRPACAGASGRRAAARKPVCRQPRVRPARIPAGPAHPLQTDRFARPRSCRLTLQETDGMGRLRRIARARRGTNVGAQLAAPVGYKVAASCAPTRFAAEITPVCYKVAARLRPCPIHGRNHPGLSGRR